MSISCYVLLNKKLVFFFSFIKPAIINPNVLIFRP